jgi:hypothetical protein
MLATPGGEPIEIHFCPPGGQGTERWTSDDIKVSVGKIFQGMGSPQTFVLEYTAGLATGVESGASPAVVNAAGVAVVGEHTLFITTLCVQRYASHPQAHSTQRVPTSMSAPIPTTNTNYVARRLHSITCPTLHMMEKKR